MKEEDKVLYLQKTPQKPSDETLLPDSLIITWGFENLVIRIMGEDIQFSTDEFAQILKRLKRNGEIKDGFDKDEA